jgi:hypothetical protein
MATQTPDYRSVRHQEESNSTPASHPAVQFSSPVPVLVNQSVTQQGDVKKAKPTGRTSTLTEDVVENVRGRMEQNPRKSVRKLSLQTGVILM